MSALIAIATLITGRVVIARPLRMSIEDPAFDRPSPPGAPATNVKFLRIQVLNQSPRPALQCRAAISFHHLDGRNVFGRTMDGRWAGTPEPVPIPVLGAQGEQFRI